MPYIKRHLEERILELSKSYQLFEILSEESKKFSPITTPELFQRLWNGCMSGLASGKYHDRNVYYSSYLSTYIERDVRELSGTIDALKFNRFITAVAVRTSQLVNYQSIADDSDIDQITAKAWLNILNTGYRVPAAPVF